MKGILAIVTQRFGSEAKAQAWYHSEPLRGADGKTAAQMVEESRAQEVLDYIEAVDAGGFT